VKAEPLVFTEKLTKAFPDILALDGIDLTVRRGEIVGLLGPNGAGKTTLINILLGLLTPTSGTVEVFGLSPLEHRARIAHRLNFSSAYVQLPSNLKVSENLRVFSDLYGIADAKRKVTEVLELFEIDGLKKRLSGALSSGEKTRLNLAKSLLNDPELLLLDEPTSSLDPNIADSVRKTLKKIQKEKKIGMLYTSHNMREVEELCDRIFFIHEGRAIAQGTCAELLERFKSRTLDQVFIKLVRPGAGDLNEL
jgi:ABC-2 type transport system ATP-binding protein